MRHAVEQSHNLILGGIAVLQQQTGELQGLACQGVVGVDGHAVFLNADDTCHEPLVVLVGHRDDGSGEDVLTVKLAVDDERLALQVVYTLFVVFAESLGWRQGEVELVAWLQLDEMLLEGIERESQACDEIERLALLGLFNEVFLVFLVDRVKRIAY